jgi:hypothetical protein
MIKFGRVFQSKGFNMPLVAIANFNLATYNTMLNGAVFKTTNNGISKRHFAKFSSEESDGANDDRKPTRYGGNDDRKPTRRMPDLRDSRGDRGDRGGFRRDDRILER